MGLKGKKFDEGFAVIDENENEVNYKDIALIMSDFGFPMKHSSARNQMIYTTKKFVSEFCSYLGIEKTDEEMMQIARDPRFQSGLKELLHYIDSNKKKI